MNSVHRTLTTLVAASCLFSAAWAAGQIDERLGLLESYLRQAERPLLARKTLGTLEGRNGTKGIFSALIAWDPTRRDVRACGVEVQLIAGQLSDKVYVDEEFVRPDESRGVVLDDSLKQLLGDLSRLIDDRDTNRGWLDPGAGGAGNRAGRGATVSALNSPAEASRTGERLPTPTYTVLDVGWYEKDGVRGVIIQYPARRHEFLFENADLAVVRNLIASAREALGATKEGRGVCPPSFSP
ncbi:MAG TPA: hypothetical protein VMO17_11650 [Terriglobia bacterium]|nr:hypothetical protein [Terriglobia bacterium]